MVHSLSQQGLVSPALVLKARRELQSLRGFFYEARASRHNSPARRREPISTTLSSM